MKRFLRILTKPQSFCILLFSHLAFFSQAQLPEVKIDFNVQNRPAAEAQEPGYTPWVVAKPLTDTLTVNGITFIVKKGPRGATLNATYYKAGIQTGVFNVRFTDDGLTVKDGDFNLGGSIYLIIKGLPTGVHSLVTYHNMVDALTPAQVCPMNVFVDSVKVVDKLVPTVRLEKTTDCATAELTINAQAGKDVVILFQADTTGTQATKNVFLNGFQLNGTNAGKKSRSPIPSNNEEHLDVPIGSNYLLRWSGSPTALTHDVYFGTDSAAVANATHSSPLYKGSKAASDTSYNATNLYSILTYYWRIDEVTATTTYKGDIWEFRTRQLAFADAEGHGKYARGGRGGKVVEVTNLNDAGPGSFREAVTNPVGPRTIVFNVSGIIQLQSRLVLSDPYVYVAGQTAPSKGICIRSAPFGITGNDAIVRFMRVRIGAGITYDGMGLTGANYSILDHSSISWTIDEAFSSRGSKNITLQRTLISEALNVAGHQNYPVGTEHGYAATIGGDTGSYHHNLLAHCYGRNWSLGGGLDAAGYLAGTMDIVNNVVYNWGSRTTDGGTKQLNFVNNYYKPGAGSTIFVALSMDHEGIGLGTQRAYFNGNVMPGRFDETNQTAGRRTTYSNGDTSSYQTFVNAPFFQSDITTQTAGNAYKNVLSDVGAAVPVLDDHDIRMVNETLTGTYSVVGSVSGKPGFPDKEADAGGYENYPAVTRATNWDSDHDGMPDWWERFKGTNPKSAANDFSESNADADLNGYTNLDDYLEWMANPHYFGNAGAAILVDLKLLARGYTSSPTFTFSSMVNASVTVNALGVATITPLANGLGSFKFTVTDAAGSNMTRLVNFASGAVFNPPVAFTGCPNVNLLIARPGYNTYNNEPLNMYNLDTATGKATVIPGGPLMDFITNKNIELNGTGLNGQDGFAYGIRDTINAAGTAQAAMFYRVGSNYGNDMLGILPAPSLLNGETLSVVNPSAGGFDDQGNYYYIGIAGAYSFTNKTFVPSSYYIGKLANVSSLAAGAATLTATWTKIDFSNAPLAYKSSIYATISSASGSSAGTSFQDLTYSNLYKSIYVYAAYNTGTDYSGQLFSINPTTGLATFYASLPTFGSYNNEVAGISTTASGNLRMFMTSGDIYKPVMANNGDFTSALVKVGSSTVPPLGVIGSIRGDLASCGIGATTLPPARPSSIIIGLPNQITAAPNPAQGVTTISVGQPLTNATVRLMGIAGNVIVERSGVSGYTFQMDMTGKPGGLYTVEVIQGGNTQVLKIMKF